MLLPDLMDDSAFSRILFLRPARLPPAPGKGRTAVRSDFSLLSFTLSPPNYCLSIVRPAHRPIVTSKISPQGCW